MKNCLRCLVAFLATVLFIPPVTATQTLIDSLTVTARKQEENIRDVPMTIDLFTETKLEDYGLETLSDVTFLSANLFMKTNTAESPIIIRGISSFKSAIFSPAGFYVDDVSSPLSYMTDPDLLDIKRVEILKGPQGTLYGRNTLSGLVKLVTRQPDNHTRGRVNFSVFGYDSDNNGMGYKTGVSLSGPLSRDRLFMGISVQGLASDGFRIDLANNDRQASKERHLDGRGTLRFTPSDRLDISFTAGESDHNDGFGVYRLVNGPDATGPFTSNSGDPGLGKDQSSHVQNLKIKYNGGNWDLVSVTSRQDYDVSFVSDMDFKGGPTYSGFAFDDTQWSQEIRMSSAAGKRLTWLAGIYGFTEKTGTGLDMKFDTPGGTINLWQPKGDIDMKGCALFSQGTWKMTSTIDLTAGLRLDHQSLSGRVVNRETAMMPFLPAYQEFEKDLSYTELLPRMALGWTPSACTTVYASAAKGYQVGGYNYSMVMSPDTFTYDPEYAWNYETGIKTAFLGNRLKANFSLFYVDIKDKQIDVNNPDAVGVPMAPDINNAGQVHTWGVELGLEADPLPGLSLFANLGILDTEIDQWRYQSQTGTIDFEGNQLPYSPKYTVSLGSTFRMDNGLFLGGDITGMGSYYGDPGNRMKQSSFELVNVRIGYEAESFDLILWCKNLFNREYFTVLDEMMSTGVLKGVEGSPRTVGVTLRYRF